MLNDIFSSSLLTFLGGPIAPLLIGLGFVGCVLFIERVLFLHRGHIRAVSFLTGIKNLLQKDRLLEALTVCEETPGPVAQVIKIALLFHDQPPRRLQGEVERCGMLQIPILNRRMASLLLIAQISPLIGLLGVLNAFLNGFLVMQNQGPYASIQLFNTAVIQGISGLFVATTIGVLCYISYHFIYGRIKSILFDIQWASSDILQYLILNDKKLTQIPTTQPSAVCDDET